MLFRTIKLAVIAMAISLMCNVSAFADPLPKVEFDWVTEWAHVSPKTNSVLNDVTRVLKDCADPTIKPSDIKMYKIDFNKDGLTDIIVDPSALQGHTSETCNAQPCVNGDCYLGVYLKKTDAPTQILIPAQEGDPVCPAKASQNTDCLAHCPALQKNCPELFQVQYQSIFNVRVGIWNIFRVGDMPLSIPNIKPNPNNGYVLFGHIYDEASPACGADEVAQYSQDGARRCLKFYQWDNATQYMYDLWTPTAQVPQGLPDKDAYNLSLFNPETLVMNARGPKTDTVNGSGFKLTKGAQIALNMQIGKQTICHTGCTNGKQIVANGAECTRECYTELARKCLVVTNNSANDYLLPNNTSDEYNAFFYHPPPGITITNCTNKYGPWKGEDVIADWLNKQPIGTRITAEACDLGGKGMYCDIAYLWGVSRDCLSALGVTLDAGVCAADESIAAIDRALGTMQKVTCYGPATCIRSVSCVADTTMILTGDGQHKLAREFKIGDEIMTFAHDAPEKHFSSKIKNIKITPDTIVMQINGLTVTGNHYFVTANRGKVAAEDLGIKDVLVKADGSHEVVATINRQKDKVTVYNFYTEKGDGFIANDILVYSVTAGAEISKK